MCGTDNERAKTRTNQEGDRDQEKDREREIPGEEMNFHKSEHNQERDNKGANTVWQQATRAQGKQRRKQQQWAGVDMHQVLRGRTFGRLRVKQHKRMDDCLERGTGQFERIVDTKQIDKTAIRSIYAQDRPPD